MNKRKTTLLFVCEERLLEQKRDGVFEAEDCVKLFEFAYKHIFSSIELGTNGYQYNKHALIKLPIRKNTIKELDNETETDRKVYELYGLTDEEIQFIESK